MLRSGRPSAMVARIMQGPEAYEGRILADKYRLERRLGGGGFGSIWRAEHTVLHAPVAVKLIDVEIARHDGVVDRFLREAQATAALRSPNVVQILDYGVDDDQPFIVMELLEGENLAERLRRVGRLAPADVIRVVAQVARAVGRAHELGIVHRDLKPENVFLVSNADEEIAKVLDFGVAKIAAERQDGEKTRTRTGSLLGTPYYMSPEQAQGNKQVDFRSDLWALGVMTFEMFTGCRPFDSDGLGDLVLSICIREIPVPSRVGAVPEGFDEWFEKAVNRDPEQRFQSARELASALIQVVEGQGGETRFTVSDGDKEAFGANPPVAAVEPTTAFAATVAEPTGPISIEGDNDAEVGGAAAADVPSNDRKAPRDRKRSGEPAQTRFDGWVWSGVAMLFLVTLAGAAYVKYWLMRPDAGLPSPEPAPTVSAKRTKPDSSASPSRRSGTSSHLSTAPSVRGAVTSSSAAPETRAKAVAANTSSKAIAAASASAAASATTEPGASSAVPSTPGKVPTSPSSPAPRPHPSAASVKSDSPDAGPGVVASSAPSAAAGHTGGHPPVEAMPGTTDAGTHTRSDSPPSPDASPAGPSEAAP